VPLSTEIKVGSVVLPLAHVVDKLDIFLDRPEVEDRDELQGGTAGSAVGEEDTSADRMQSENDKGKEKEDKPQEGPTAPTFVQFCFAKFVIRHFLRKQAQNPTGARHIPFIKPLLGNPELLGTGEPLEYLLRTVLAFRLSQAYLLAPDKDDWPTWADCFPHIFEGSVVEKVKVPHVDQVQVSYLPRMCSKAAVLPATGITAIKEGGDIWAKSVSLYSHLFSSRITYDSRCVI